MRSYSILMCAAVVAAQPSAPATSVIVPTISPTYEPTTTYSPTGIPTKAPLPAPVPVRPCYSNLTEVADLVRLKNPFLLETYILCPNTVYQMGTQDATTYEFTNGSAPIYTRANSIYQCGEDGKSSNNCVISGGEYHVFHEYITYGRENKINVVMKGLTFEAATGGGIIMAAPGDLTFVDCVFRGHENTGILPMLYSYTESRRLEAIMGSDDEGDSMSKRMKYYYDILHDPEAMKTFKEDAARSHQRRLQGGEILEFQNLTIDGCLFEDNRHGPAGSLTIDGMIYLAAASNVLIVKNTIFRNNVFTTPVNGGNGYAVSAVSNAKMTYTDVCFIDNKFIGSGAVVVEGSNSDLISTNVFGTVDPTLSCAYASIGLDTCVEFNSPTCTASSTGFVPAATTPTRPPVSNAATDDQSTSGSVSMNTGLHLLVLFMSVIVAL